METIHHYYQPILIDLGIQDDIQGDTQAQEDIQNFNPDRGFQGDFEVDFKGRLQGRLTLTSSLWKSDIHSLSPLKIKTCLKKMFESWEKTSLFIVCRLLTVEL